MKYDNSVEARFISRPNRFIAECEIENEIHRVHVKNTGRLSELLIPGCTVFLTKPDTAGRKTEYDLVCVKKDSDGIGVLFNVDSQAANDAVEEFIKRGGLFESAVNVKREVKYKNSRFDFFVETDTEKIYLEVKGVTLDIEGRATFPDAPTQRGLKHIEELISAAKDGYSAYILFVVQYKGAYEFCANTETHPEFAKALERAQLEGVLILAVDCDVTPLSMNIDEFVKVNI